MTLCPPMPMSPPCGAGPAPAGPVPSAVPAAIPADRREHVVCILCPGRPGSARAGGIGTCVSNLVREVPRADPNFRIRAIDTRGSGHIALSPFFFLAALAQLAGLALSDRVALVHVNVSGHGSTLRKFLAVLLMTALRVPLVLHLHGSSFDAFYRSLPTRPRRAVRWMFRRAGGVIVLGAYWQRFAVEELGVAPERIEVICNGVASPTETRRTLDDGPAHLVFLGRLEERKGVSTLLAALASRRLVGRDWRATLAGDGDRARYLEEAHRLGIADRIGFPGWIDKAGTERLLQGATLLALPSRAEALPMAVLEALAHRVPVVATPVGSVPDFLEHGRSALFVEPGDVDGLACALERLILSPDLRARLAEQGREVFEENFDVTVVARKVASIYRKVGSAPARARPPDGLPGKTN